MKSTLEPTEKVLPCELRETQQQETGQDHPNPYRDLPQSPLEKNQQVSFLELDKLVLRFMGEK